jgi:hypothetical protein
MDSANRDDVFDRPEEPATFLKGVFFLIIPSLLTWVGVIELGRKIWMALHG